MADNTAEKLEPQESPGAKKQKPPVLLMSIIILNTIAFVGVGALLYLNKKAELAKPTMEPLIEGAVEDQKSSVESGGAYVIPLDYFLVNLSEDQGHKLFKVKMEFDVDSAEVMEEINKRMPQVRDIIIILLSSKNYSQVSTAKGKELLKEEIRDTVNSFLTKGKINKVLFTEFIYS
ncbi:MAG: flagellar basal body-associated FliL family protein [Bdellovibrionales bacterium]|nr:flagellar basal body-associated FliL family protein [Bdellovibrionales bacterium]